MQISFWIGLLVERGVWFCQWMHLYFVEREVRCLPRRCSPCVDVATRKHVRVVPSMKDSYFPLVLTFSYSSGIIY
jgi:hypothetical protein